MEESLVRIKDVWKIYKLGEVDIPVLRGVNMEIYPGDFTSIMGASGSGKSTLLHLAGCLDVPTKGNVFWKGRDITEISEDELAQIRGREVGFVFQQFNLLQNLSALDNVALPMVFQGVSLERRVAIAKELLFSFGMEKRIFHKPTELSGGEQQRVALARSLANDPEILVADEPTGNLDSKTGKMIMEILVSLHKKDKKTIIVVTHDPNIAEYSEKIINIKDGLIVKNHIQSKKSLWVK